MIVARILGWILLPALFLIGCAQERCSENCFKTLQTPLSIPVLYDAFQGSALASILPMEERIIAAYNAQRTLKDKQLNLPYYWRSPDNFVSGTFENLAFQRENETDCIQYKQTLSIEGTLLIAQGLACEDSSHVWRIVNERPDNNPWFENDPFKGLKLSSDLKAKLSRFVE